MIDSEKLFKSELHEFLTFTNLYYIKGSINELIQTNLLIMAAMIWKKSYEEIASISFDIIEDIHFHNYKKYCEYFSTNSIKITNQMLQEFSPETTSKKMKLLDKLHQNTNNNISNLIKKELSNADGFENAVTSKVTGTLSLNDLMKDLNNEK